jgi:hypothetical protein
MNRHLSEDEFSEWILGAEEPRVAEHLRSCAVCLAELGEVRQTVSCYREQIRAVAERDEIFWTKQRIKIREQLVASRRLPLLRWAFNGIAALVLLAALLLVRAPEVSQRANIELNDDTLLAQVENDIQRDYPAALAPAVLIDEERSLALSNDNTLFLNSPQDKEQHR